MDRFFNYITAAGWLFVQAAMLATLAACGGGSRNEGEAEVVLNPPEKVCLDMDATGRCWEYGYAPSRPSKFPTQNP